MKRILPSALLLGLCFAACIHHKANATNAAIVAGNKKDTIPLAKQASHAQSTSPVLKDTITPQYMGLAFPDFRILQSVNKKSKDSTWFSPKDLPTKRPLVITYFSPECGHCHHEMKEILKNMDSLKQAFFVFASFHDLDSIKGFAEKYELSKYSNIAMGRDTKYYLPVFYHVKFTPFVAVYDADRMLVKVYEQGADMHEMIQLVNAAPAGNATDKKSKKKAATN
ncbi:peroxiredoxin family protein [Parasediminibacterium sp. JCM 36343]|uniref:peroxiredoxin family protein n=1 Tax=Parasediminibacterium sp. JCM 36343 TaxID=3374279 RepID=UPI00397A8CF6